MRRISRILLTLLALRLTVLAMRAFLPLSFPEVWRQVVTLGVSLRYWSRWTVESLSTHPLLPAILDSSDTAGIMPMEFPILNLITAPAFALGPHWGRAVATGVAALLAFGLTWLNGRIWKGKKIAGIQAYPALLLMPIFSIATAWSGKFMPDFISMTLVLLAVGLSWEKSQPLKSFALAVLGLLMKPTAIIVFALYLGHSELRKKWRTVAPWTVAAVAIAGLYFVYGIRFIAQYQELPSAVGLKPRPALDGVVSFFMQPVAVLRFYFEKAFFLGGGLLTLLVALFTQPLSGLRRLSPLWAISLLQFLAIAALDGPQLFYNHDYYLIGMTPTFCLLFFEAWQRAEGLRRSARLALQTLMSLGVLIPLLETSAIDLKPLYRKPALTIWSLDSQTRELRDRNPAFPWRSGYVFRSTPEAFPMLGLYFGERQASQRSQFGFFYKNSGVPSDCSVVDQTADLVLATCRGL